MKLQNSKSSVMLVFSILYLIMIFVVIVVFLFLALRKPGDRKEEGHHQAILIPAPRAKKSAFLPKQPSARLGGPQTRTHRSIPAPPTPGGASRLPRTAPYPPLLELLNGLPQITRLKGSRPSLSERADSLPPNPKTSRRLARIAMQMPISRVRSLTKCAITL